MRTDVNHPINEKKPIDAYVRKDSHRAILGFETQRLDEPILGVGSGVVDNTR